MGIGWGTFGLKSTVRKGKVIGKKANRGVKMGVKKIHHYAPMVDKGLATAEKVAAAGVLVPGLSPYAAAATAGLAATRGVVGEIDKTASSIEKNRKKANRASKAFV